MQRVQQVARALAERVRGEAIRQAIILGGGTCGPGLTAQRGSVLGRPAHPGIKLGANVHLGRGTILHVDPGAELTVGDNCKFMHFSIIACQGRMTIGCDTQVAEHCSVRDADHGLSRDLPIRSQESVGELHIGSDVWIARGCAVLKGARVGNGAVVAANSVVKGEVEPYAIVAGAPARLIRHR